MGIVIEHKPYYNEKCTSTPIGVLFYSSALSTKGLPSYLVINKIYYSLCIVSSARFFATQLVFFWFV